MKFDNKFIKWLNEWENPRSLEDQGLEEHEWNFLVSLQNRHQELFYFKVCPAVDKYIKDENIGFNNEKSESFSAKEHLFINSMDLTNLRKNNEWEIAYANRLDYTIIHVYLNKDDISYIGCTF